MIPETNFIVIILIILYTRNYSSGLITVKTLFSRGQKWKVKHFLNEYGRYASNIIYLAC